jgi:hypothetical protein
MFNEDEILDELSHPTMVRLEVHDRHGISFSYEARGAGIDKIREVIRHCRCDETVNPSLPNWSGWAISESPLT